jgi:hypothetical protein
MHEIMTMKRMRLQFNINLLKICIADRQHSIPNCIPIVSLNDQRTAVAIHFIILFKPVKSLGISNVGL